jgi:hypothetical protein
MPQQGTPEALVGYPDDHVPWLTKVPEEPDRPPIDIQMLGVITRGRALTVALSNPDHRMPTAFMVTKSSDVNLAWMDRQGLLPRCAIGVSRFCLSNELEILDRDPLARSGAEDYANTIPQARLGFWQTCLELGLDAAMQVDDDMVCDRDLVRRHEQALAYGIAASCTPSMQGPNAIPDNSALHHAARLAGYLVPVYVSGSNLSYRLPRPGSRIDDYFIGACAQIYGEDWDAFYGLARPNGLVYAGTCIQRALGDGLRRVMTPRKAELQEGPDAFFEGRYWLLEHKLPPTLDNWSQHLEIRRMWVSDVGQQLARLDSNPMIDLARATTRAGASRLDMVTPQQCIDLGEKFDAWRSRVVELVMDGEKLVDITWLHDWTGDARGVDDRAPRQTRIRGRKWEAHIASVDSGSQGVPRKLKIRPGPLDLPRRPMAEYDVAAYAEGLMLKIFGDDLGRHVERWRNRSLTTIAEQFGITPQPSVVTILHEMHRQWPEREALLRAVCDRYLPFVLGVCSPRVDNDSALTIPVDEQFHMNEWFAEFAAADSRVVAALGGRLKANTTPCPTSMATGLAARGTNRRSCGHPPHAPDRWRPRHMMGRRRWNRDRGLVTVAGAPPPA